MQIRSLLRKVSTLALITIIIGEQCPVMASVRLMSQQQEVVSAPITWERSSEQKNSVKSVEEGRWSWQTASSIETPINNVEKIWDAPYTPYYSGYLWYMENGIYSSATWETQNEVDLRRFTGKFQIPEGYSTEDFIRMESVNQANYSHLNGGNIVPINDNIYVFVYPENIKELINDDKNSPYYFMNYMAFWTGTANRIQYGIQYFYGKAGTYATRDPENGPGITDGWYAEAAVDNIGSIMHGTTNGAGAGTNFVIDVFTEDNSPGGGGGMDELILLFEHNPKAKVIANDESYAMPVNQEVLVQSNEGLLANDSPLGVVSAEILEGTKGIYKTVKDAESQYNIYKNGKLIGHIGYADSNGQFKFVPSQDYVGEVQFDYLVKDKLGKSDTATATIYIMPQVEIKHVEAATGKEIVKTEYVYGNPYTNMPSETIYLNNTKQLAGSVEIKKNNELENIYAFKNITIIDEETKNIAEPVFNYNFIKNNAQIILKYDQVQSNVIIHHQYSDDEEKNYSETVQADTWSNLNFRDYVDTTADHQYGQDKKYEVASITLKSTKYPDKVFKANELTNEGKIELEDMLSVIAGMDYEITYSYEVKSYTVSVKHVYGSQEIEDKEYKMQVKYGEKYSLESELVENYELGQVMVDGVIQEGENAFIEVQGNYEINYYYEKVSSDEENTPEEVPGIGGENNPEELPDDDEAGLPEDEIPGGIPDDEENSDGNFDGEIEMPDEDIPGLIPSDEENTGKNPDEEVEKPDEEAEKSDEEAEQSTGKIEQSAERIESSEGEMPEKVSESKVSEEAAQNSEEVEETEEVNDALKNTLKPIDYQQTVLNKQETSKSGLLRRASIAIFALGGLYSFTKRRIRKK